MEVETWHFEFGDDTKICQSVLEKPILSKLDECINSIVKKEGYISCDVTKKVIPANGGNYLATIAEVDIKGKTANGDKETSLFIKSADSDCEAMEVLTIPGIFITELFVYKELIPIYNELQDDANVPVTERFNTVKCYKESYEKAIIMENITKKGFHLPGHRMDVISLKTAKYAIKHLAKFHALSYVLEQRRPKYFVQKVKSIKTKINFGEPWEKFTEKLSNMALQCLDEEVRNKIENKIPAVMKKLKEYYTDETIMCLCHVDYRPNNIMLKEMGDNVMIILLDYQMVFCGCPVLDFIYFMYLSTDRQFRSENLVYLKNHYYNSLDDFLRYFDMAAESVFPKNVFEDILEKKLDFGLATLFLHGPFLFVSENEDIPDITDKKMAEVDLTIDGKFKDRLRDAVEEFIDFGYF